MKKKQFHSKLNLNKHKISNLQQNSIQGGTDTITSTTYIIVTTIKILTAHITSPRVCITVVTVPITLTLITDEC